MKILTTVTASAGLDVASTGSDTIKLGSTNTENNDAVVDNLIVWANADFKNNVTLGNSVADNTLVNSKLTASNGLYVSGNLYLNGVNITASGGSSGVSLTISEISGTTKTNEVANVSAIRFDKNTGFNVSNLGSGEVEVSLGSTFKTWNVTGQSSLVAVGEDTIEIIAGNGIGLTTNTSSNPKSLTISYTGSIGVTSQQITSALNSYATLVGVSSSFTTPVNVTSALTPYLLSLTAASTYTTPVQISSSYPTRTEVTGATNSVLSTVAATYATLSGVSGTFISSSQLNSYATLSGVSSSFVTPSNVTSAISSFPTRTEVTSGLNSALSLYDTSGIVNTKITNALVPYATLTGVSGTFVSSSQLSSYAKSADVTSSFTIPTQITSALSSYATLSGISGTFVTNANATSSLARLAAANIFTANQIITGNLNLTADITSNNISASTKILAGSIGIGQANPNASLAPNAKLFVNGEIAAGSSATMTIKGDSNCVIVGSQAGGSNTNSIVAVGKNALSASTGGYNVAIGNDTLVTSSGARNVALGYAGLNGNTTGLGNIAVGYQPLFYNTIGNYNIAQGYWALQNNTTGEYNTAIGFQALYSNATGSYNLAIGQNAGSGLSTGSYNVFIGKYTGVTNSEKSVYISDNFGNLKLSADSAGLVTIQNGLAVNGNTILGDAAADTITTSGSLNVLNNIKFPATQVASADANTLDDYEEGTWTPALSCSTTTSFTYTSRAGNYTKVGRLVTATGYIFLSATGSSSGNVRIGSLPFASMAGAAAGDLSIGDCTGFAVGITNPPIGHVLPSNTIASLSKGSAGGSTTITVTDLTNNTILAFTVTFYST